MLEYSDFGLKHMKADDKVICQYESTPDENHCVVNIFVSLILKTMINFITDHFLMMVLSIQGLASRLLELKTAQKKYYPRGVQRSRNRRMQNQSFTCATTLSPEV